VLSEGLAPNGGGIAKSIRNIVVALELSFCCLGFAQTNQERVRVMTDRESLIKERAYSLWESEGNPDGRHEDHWVQAEQEIDGDNTQSLATDTQPPELFSGAIPLPDQSGTGNEERGVPPARTGKSANVKNPVEGAGPDNPTHHTGQQPLDPLAK
jgi:hypothetical protein